MVTKVILTWKKNVYIYITVQVGKLSTKKITCPCNNFIKKKKKKNNQKTTDYHCTDLYLTCISQTSLGGFRPDEKLSPPASGYQELNSRFLLIIIIRRRIRIIYNNNRIQRRYSRFFTIYSQCHELSPTRTLKWPRRNRVQITCNTSNAYHVQVSCYVPRGMKGQLSY